MSIVATIANYKITKLTSKGRVSRVYAALATDTDDDKDKNKNRNFDHRRGNFAFLDVFLPQKTPIGRLIIANFVASAIARANNMNP